MPGPSSSLPPRRSNRTTSSPQASEPVRKRPAPKRSGPPIGVFLGAGAAVLLLGAGLFFAVKLLGSGKVGERLADVGLPDVGLPNIVSATPSSMIGDFVEIAKDVQKTLDSVTDEASRDAAVADFDSLSKRVRELNRGLATVTPVSKQELDSIAAQYESQLDLKSFENSAQRLLGSNLLSPEFTAVLMTTGQELHSVLSTLKTSLETLPEPRGDGEALYHDYSQLHRDTARVLANVESTSGVSPAVAELQAIEKKFEELTQRKIAASHATSGPASAKYLKYSTTASALSGRLSQLIATELGEQPTLGDAYVAVSTASSNFDFGTVRPESGREARGSAGGLAENPADRFATPAVAGGTITVILTSPHLAIIDQLAGPQKEAAVAMRDDAVAAAVEHLKGLGATEPQVTYEPGEAHITFDDNGSFDTIVRQHQLGVTTRQNYDTRTITIEAEFGR